MSPESQKKNKREYGAETGEKQTYRFKVRKNQVYKLSYPYPDILRQNF